MYMQRTSVFGNSLSHTQTVANGPLSAKFAPPWLKPLVTPLQFGHNIRKGTHVTTVPASVDTITGQMTEMS